MTGRLLCRSEDNGLNDHIEAQSCRNGWPQEKMICTVSGTSGSGWGGVNGLESLADFPSF
jgi:hypothetical protein